jgi:ribosomal protein S18 acetylase RimI-like enzyme
MSDKGDGDDNGYRTEMQAPAAREYCVLRIAAGLSPRSMTAAQAGLPNTVVGITIRRGGVAIGMGRVIGDGLCYQIVDIAVEPAHQGRGLGKTIMAALMDSLHKLTPAEAYVSLIADGEASRLYAQYGFAPTAPESIGMQQWINTDRS